MSVLLCSRTLTESPPGFPASNLASNAKEMGKIKLFPTTEYSSKQSSDPVVPLVPCTGIFLGPSKSGKTVALISLILEQYRGVFERIYVFSPSVNIDDGWIPVKKYIEGDLGMMSQSSDLHALRAITVQQPRASKIPPLVPEHRQVIVLRGPLSVSLPVLPMSRIKVSWTAPAGLEPAGAVVPAESQLLRVSPFRPRGGVRDELAPVAGLLDKHSVEIAWGVPFSPTQFVAEALRVGHPQNLDLVLPGALACVECIRHWTARAKELAPAEKSLKRNMPDNLRCLLAPKRILLWEEMLKACGYTDLGVVAELKEGTVLTGVVPPTGVFPAAFRPAIVREETLKQFARTARKSILYATRSSGDHSLDEKVYAMTLDEVHSGWLEGPIDVRSLPDDAVISRRFGLQQPNKVRLIDDLSISQLNSTVQASESPRPQSTDVIGALVVQLMRQLPGRSLLGRTYDLKSAYR